MCKIKNQIGKDNFLNLFSHHFFVYLNSENWEGGKGEVKARKTGLQVKELCLTKDIDWKTKR